MKKLFSISIATIVLFVASLSMANDIVWPNKSTKTASASITTGPGVFGGIVLATDGTNAVTLTVYDSSAASGTKLFPTMTITTSATDRIQSIAFPVRYYTGLYVSITCAGSVEYTVYFEAK
jgi:hypothetical protein